MMKRYALAAGYLALAALAPNAMAQVVTARVVSATPIIQQVPVTRNQCQNEAVTVPGSKTGAGAIMGGIAGGAVGNSIGGGNGRAAATVLGVLGGAVLGDRIEGPSQPQTQYVQRCYPQTTYENRTAGYTVVYELGGQRYSAQMPGDPGPTLQVQLSPVAPPPSGYYAPQGGYRPPVANPYNAYPNQAYPYDGDRAPRWRDDD